MTENSELYKESLYIKALLSALNQNVLHCVRNPKHKQKCGKWNISYGKSMSPSPFIFKSIVLTRLCCT